MSPVAAIKLTRHNLWCPTALFHETGHQVAHLTGWTGELGDCLAQALAPRSAELASAWRGWASEVAADVHAFAQAGWAPLAPLANVVDGPTSAVYRLDPERPASVPLDSGDVQRGPVPELVRCRPMGWRGRGLGAPAPAREGSRRCGRPGPTQRRRLLGDIVDLCTRRPMAAFGGRPLHALADPSRVSPAALDALAPPDRRGAADVAVPVPSRLARHPGVAVDAADDRSDQRHRSPQSAAGLVGHAVPEPSARVA